MKRRIDFNCDLGEGCASDAAIMPFISSANIACGAHAGDEASMRETLRRCREFGVAAGAHPGYADREHFGRRELNPSVADLASSLHEQLQRLAAIAADEGVPLLHVKPHGALYNQAARDAKLAETIASVVRDFDAGLILVGLAESALPRAGIRHGLRVAHEAFADRRYLGDGSLAPRERAEAVIGEVDIAVAQALAIAKGDLIASLDGDQLRIRADSICLHGDSPGAAEFATRLRRAFETAGIAIKALDAD